MGTIHKALDKASQSGLRLVVVGQGETRGRRPHCLRLRESLVQDLRIVADGQMYFLVEVALQRMIDELKLRPDGLEVIRSSELEPSPDDYSMMDQHAAKMKKKRAPKKSASPKV